MDKYRVVCTEQSEPVRPGHGHILAVGLGQESGKATARHDVQTVRRRLLAQEAVYFTTGDASGKTALVEAYDCACGVRTIRSAADAVTDNNLDSLRLCNFK